MGLAGTMNKTDLSASHSRCCETLLKAGESRHRAPAGEELNNDRSRTDSESSIQICLPPRHHRRSAATKHWQRHVTTLRAPCLRRRHEHPAAAVTLPKKHSSTHDRGREPRETFRSLLRLALWRAGSRSKSQLLLLLLLPPTTRFQDDREDDQLMDRQAALVCITHTPTCKFACTRLLGTHTNILTEHTLRNRAPRAHGRAKQVQKQVAPTLCLTKEALAASEEEEAEGRGRGGGPGRKKRKEEEE